MSDNRSCRPPGVPEPRANDPPVFLVNLLWGDASRAGKIYMISCRLIRVVLYVAGVVAVAGFMSEERELVGMEVCHETKQA